MSSGREVSEGERTRNWAASQLPMKSKVGGVVFDWLPIALGAVFAAVWSVFIYGGVTRWTLFLPVAWIVAYPVFDFAMRRVVE